ncbi:MAG TPA: GNAT family N-acetyltransferase [Burkholderiales bacterium]|nr:GNAT family N-acetyltransferase [Burkholderiales bacterium]
MPENCRIIAVTDERRELVAPEWLARAEGVHRQLRPKLPAGYAAKMKLVFDQGGEMCVAVIDGEVAGLAVFRVFENTHVGRRFYVDDLVTGEKHRSTGVGKALIAWLEGEARRRACPGLDLESGTHRTEAHRFYFREGFVIPSFSFRKDFP